MSVRDRLLPCTELSLPILASYPGTLWLARICTCLTGLTSLPFLPGALPSQSPADVYQRAMILDGLSAAAAEIAKPGSTLPPLPGLHKAPPKQLTEAAAERAAAAAAAAVGLTPEQQRLLTTTAHGSKRVGTVTRIASRSLAAAARQQGGAGQAAHINRWAGECGQGGQCACRKAAGGCRLGCGC